MFHLAYVSHAVQLMRIPELAELLAQARRLNVQHDITGMLLYKDKSFLQVLEGDQQAVLETYARIQTDPRHHNLLLLFQEPIAAREFGDWSMGFQNLDGRDLSDIDGYSHFLEPDAPLALAFTDLTRAKKLLLLFRKHS